MSRDEAKHHAATKRWTETHREQVNAQAKRWREEHHDQFYRKRRESLAAVKAADPAAWKKKQALYHKRSYRKHRAEILTRQKPYALQRYWADPGKFRAKRRAYGAAHREEERLRSAAYNASHKKERREKRTAFVKTHRAELAAKALANYHSDIERSRAKQRDYNRKHREHKRAYKRKWNTEHREELAAKGREHYHLHREEICRRERVNRKKPSRQAAIWKSVHKHGAAKRGAVAVAKERVLTKSQWLTIQKLQHGNCYWCGRKRKLTMDHVIPVSKGGPHTAENVAGACKSCNSKKRDKIVTLF